MNVSLEDGRRSVMYITLRAVLEAPRNGNAYATVTAYSDGSVAIDGVGTIPTCVIDGNFSSTTAKSRS